MWVPGCGYGIHAPKCVSRVIDKQKVWARYTWPKGVSIAVHIYFGNRNIWGIRSSRGVIVYKHLASLGGLMSAGLASKNCRTCGLCEIFASSWMSDWQYSARPACLLVATLCTSLLWNNFLPTKEQRNLSQFCHFSVKCRFPCSVYLTMLHFGLSQQLFSAPKARRGKPLTWTIIFHVTTAMLVLEWKVFFHKEHKSSILGIIQSSFF